MSAEERFVVYEGWQVVAVMDRVSNRMVAVFELSFHPDAVGAAKEECKRLNAQVKKLKGEQA